MSGKAQVIQRGNSLHLVGGAWFEVYRDRKKMLLTIIPAPPWWKCIAIRVVEGVRKWWQFRSWRIK